jgi:hypothetical protein
LRQRAEQMAQEQAGGASLENTEAAGNA